ncbi:MAG TPA: hypothetical protein VJA47_03080 [archaeon]|nr:hypothetical protein [archaeon]
MNKEDIIVKKIAEKLKELLNNYQPLKEKFDVGCHINILKDIEIIPNPDTIRGKKTSKFCLIVGDAEQDIVVYRKDCKIEIPFDNCNIKKAKRSFIKMKNHVPHVIIPYIIFEIKYKKINTHQVTQYSSMAGQMKELFPHLSYSLVIIDSFADYSEKVGRHGKNFDKIIPLLIDPDTENGIKRIADNLFGSIKTTINYQQPMLFFGISESEK